MGHRFHINTGSPVPIHRQITDQIRLAAATGKFRAGDALPSVRALAEELVINPNTVARSYADLSREGLIEPRPGLGVFIASKRRVYTREEARRRLEPLLTGLISESVALGCAFEDLREFFEGNLLKWSESKGQSDE